MKVVNDIAQALSLIPNGSSIFVQGGMATPTHILSKIQENLDKLDNLFNIEFMHLHTHGDAFYAAKNYANRFKVTNFFVGSNVRNNLDYEHVDYLPCFLSEIPNLFKSKAKRVDICLIHVTPPNEHGFCSLGTSVDIVKAAIDNSKLIIAQINKQMPWVYGDGIIHKDKIDFAVEIDVPILLSESCQASKIEQMIGQNIASLIEDGSTLQMGIGAIPDAALSCLTNHKHLGIHTEMFSDQAVALIEKGVVDNSMKNFHRGKTVSSFVMGTQKLVNFINQNPSVCLLEADYVNNPRNISRNPKVVAINSAIEVDLTGQVCADSIGHRIYSGVGGQMDFIRGASLSPGGKPIIALASQTHKGESKITASLHAGAGVVTTRSHIHYVATEYGVVNLYAKTLAQRAKELISIAHPDHREELGRAWRDNHQIKL